MASSSSQNQQAANPPPPTPNWFPADENNDAARRREKLPVAITATIIATISFTVLCLPPGSTWSVDVKDGSKLLHKAGESVMYSLHPVAFPIINTLNLQAFFSALFCMALVLAPAPGDDMYARKAVRVTLLYALVCLLISGFMMADILLVPGKVSTATKVGMSFVGVGLFVLIVSFYYGRWVGPRILTCLEHLCGPWAPASGPAQALAHGEVQLAQQDQVQVQLAQQEE